MSTTCCFIAPRSLYSILGSLIHATATNFAVNTYSITSYQNVSIQVQPVPYQSQPGHNQHGDNPANYQRHFHWGRSRQLSNPAINPGQKWHTGTQAQLSNKQLIHALNATQGHKRSYQTSYNVGSKCHTGTLAQLSNKVLPIHPKLKGTISSLFIKTGNDYYLAVNCMELLFKLDILCYKLT